MNGIKFIITFVFIIILSNVAASQVTSDPDPTATGLAEADKLYAENRYDEAITVYEEIMQINGVSAPILYNTGNACYKANEIGKAILCYERALKLDPSNEQIRNNLEYLRTKVDDLNKEETKGRNISITPDAPSFIAGVYSNITKETSSNYWALFAAFSFVLFVAFLSLYIFTRNVNARKCGFFGSLLFVAFTLIFLIFAFAASKAYYSKDDGIVTAYKIELRTEPSKDAKPSTTPLNCGTKLSVLDKKDDGKGGNLWYKVRLNSEFLGWIKSEDFELI